MEETLGKRIIANRKRLGMTQDRLAEQLGVTAQAVSKWENDQSCPDITMLPKLADIFGISIDALLGIAAQEKIHEAEVVGHSETEEAEPEGIHFQKDNWEFRWGGGRTNRIWFAIWVLLMGALMLYHVLLHRQIDLFDLAWTSGLLLFGLKGLYPGFSFFRMGCALFGGYSLLEELQITVFGFSSQVLVTVAVLLFGLSLLVDALRKPKGHRYTFNHNIRNVTKTQCNISNDFFDCTLSFGEKEYRIDTPRLRGGNVSLSFGELEIDLSGCEEIAPGCTIDASCSFGELTIKVPRCYRMEADSSTAFANFDVKGSPDHNPKAVIKLDASANFGEICVKYI